MRLAIPKVLGLQEYVPRVEWEAPERWLSASHSAKFTEWGRKGGIGGVGRGVRYAQ